MTSKRLVEVNVNVSLNGNKRLLDWLRMWHMQSPGLV